MATAKSANGRELKYSEAIREALDQSMNKDSSVFVIGEGVPDPKNIFGTTAGLLKKYGGNRVLDMPVSEAGVTGICIGASLEGLKPVMVHQRLDFLLLAIDQIVNNAAKWHYMFGGKMSVPIVIRAVIGRGWGQGSQHSQSLHSLFAHIPGLKVVMPSTAYDAKGLFIASLQDKNPVIFIEHRWLYNIVGHVPEEGYALPIGKAAVVQSGSQLTVVAASHMLVEVMKAARALNGVSIEIIDPRTIKPLDFETIKASVEKTGRLLVVDLGHYSFGFAAEVIAKIAEQTFGKLKAPPQRVALPDLPTPSTPELAKYYYPNHLDLIKKIGEVVGLPLMEIERVMESEMGKMPEKLDVPDPSFTGPF